jgi:hypothetical protein
MTHTQMKWYTSSNKDSLQGLVCDEITGDNIAVTYNPEHAYLVSKAPALFQALKKIADAEESDWGYDHPEKKMIAFARSIVDEIENES